MILKLVSEGTLAFSLMFVCFRKKQASRKYDENTGIYYVIL